MEKDNYMDKEILINYLKTLPDWKDKTIIDVQDIKRVNNIWDFFIIVERDDKKLFSFHSTILNDDYDKYRLKLWYDKNWKNL
jgi:hypothetical protein